MKKTKVKMKEGKMKKKAIEENALMHFNSGAFDCII
jgi:hypothetical protein